MRSLVRWETRLEVFLTGHDSNSWRPNALTHSAQAQERELAWDTAWSRIWVLEGRTTLNR